MHDVCIVGAGPAGLNAALVLGRCGRNVVVFDSGQPRNAASPALHGYLTRDGVPPLELRRLGRAELAAYPSVRVEDMKVVSARRLTRGFEINTFDDRRITARFLLLATGRVDVLPDQRGFRKFYGRGVYHCPYCDGWERREQRLVAHGCSADAADLALALLTWSQDITLCLDGKSPPPEKSQRQLAANGIRLRAEAIAELRGDERLQEVVFADGKGLACDALFFTSACLQKSELPEMLGCQFDGANSVVCVKNAATGIPGLYVAGNVRGGVHLAIMAAAEGAEAAVAINHALLEQSLQ